jgi:ubiquinone/menaquinone biosynthesis C-methylase UbiE
VHPEQLGAAAREEEILPVLQSREETRAFYDKISRVYDLLAERSEEPVREAGLRKLSAAPGEKILEIGFGTGHCLVELARAVGPAGRVYGLDLSEGMVSVAQERLRAAALADRAELTQGDAVSLPYPSGQIDAIFMSFTLELFDTTEIPQVLSECRRVLAPGGRIVVAGLSKEGEGGIILHAFEWVHQHLPNLLDCRPIFVRRAVEEAGFRVVEIERQMMWVPVEIVLAIREGL